MASSKKRQRPTQGSKRTSPLKTSELALPARFRHVPLLDLLADAAHHHRLAKQAATPYEVNRLARASITASCLSIECIANCLIASVDASAQLASEIEKMSALTKIDIYLKLNGKPELDRGCFEVQMAAELIRLRNDYVHPKIVMSDADMSTPVDHGEHWLVPFKMQAKFWPTLHLPKQPQLWDCSASKAALEALSKFFRYVIVDLVGAEQDKIARLLISSFEVGEALIPAVFDEYKNEIGATRDDGIDFSFLAL